jgi:hypothetical protein
MGEAYLDYFLYCIDGGEAGSSTSLPNCPGENMFVMVYPYQAPL